MSGGWCRAQRPPTTCRGCLHPGASEKTDDGWIYFGGNKGVNYFHPDSLLDSDFQPNVVLTSFKKHNIESNLERSIFYTDTVFLAYDEDNFSFEFSAFDYKNTKKINYSYKLENFDNEWINSGNRRYANYTHLNYGEYLFKVRATNSDGVWSDNYAQIYLIISPPFWSTWYFRTLLILFIFATAFYYYKRKKKELESERRTQEIFTEKLIESQEQERKRIASGLHDSLGQNLLIIKNRALLGLNSPNVNSIKKELQEISNSASVAINEVRHISYNLHPYQLSRLGLTKAIESIISNVESVSEISFAFTIDNIDNLVPKKFEINIYRIIQETINNIIKHSKANSVEVAVSKTDGNIVINIKDDGIGFDIKKVASKGFGLQNMSKRVNLLIGTLDIESEIDKGTNVTINIPINENGQRS